MKTRTTSFFPNILVWILALCLSFSAAQATAANPHKKKDYKRILNDYCNHYLYSCFEDVQYIDGSLWIRDISLYDDTHIFIKGTFAYKDFSNKKHYANWFQSVIETEASEVQRIIFRMERPADMTHTQPYWDECSQLFGKKESEIQEKAFYTDLLNDFCAEKYSQCFSGRSFEENSIKIKSIKNDKQRGYLLVQGTHNYIGRTGTVYREYKFEAKIREDDAGETFTIEFNKESSADMLHSNTYWENCTKSISRYDW